MGDKRSRATQYLAGLHQALGRAYLANKNQEMAETHFEAARLLAPHLPNTSELLLNASLPACRKIGLYPQAARIFKKELDAIKHEPVDAPALARIQVLETELELLQHELSIAQRRRQLYRPAGEEEAQPQADPNNPQWLDWLKTRSMSQLGQDLWVLEQTNYKRGGYFVEFGATDGVMLSNTWLLEEEFGWTGLLAEPNPKFFAKLKKNRSCIVSNQLIGRETGREVEFILADAFGSIKEFASSDMHKEKRDAYEASAHVITCTSISLHDFLLQHQAPRDIDYVSIDTEGNEFDLLSSFPFEKWNIKLLSIEHNFTPQRELIRNLMTHHGYRCTECKFDDWYEKVNLKEFKL